MILVSIHLLWCPFDVDCTRGGSPQMSRFNTPTSRMPGYDEYSQVNFRQGLSEKEKRALFKGMRVYGFEEIKSGAGRFFNCRLKCGS